LKIFGVTLLRNSFIENDIGQRENIYYNIVNSIYSFLPISAYTSQTLLLRNVIELNLTVASLGILSTLNIYYFIGLSAVLILLVLSFICYRSNTLTIISVFMAIIYFVDYPLLLSPFPPYLADATAFSTQSLAVSIFGYSSIAKWLYNGGAYPVASLVVEVFDHLCKHGAVCTAYVKPLSF